MTMQKWSDSNLPHCVFTSYEQSHFTLSPRVYLIMIILCM